MGRGGKRKTQRRRSRKREKAGSMGNANGREDGANGRNEDDDESLTGGRSNGDLGMRGNYARPPGRMVSSESMENSTPPGSPRRAVSPILFGSQVFLLFYLFMLEYNVCIFLDDYFDLVLWMRIRLNYNDFNLCFFCCWWKYL